MLNIDKIIGAIKLDKELLTPEEQKEAMAFIKSIKFYKWESCDTRPYMSMPCLISYSDGEIVTGEYVYNASFDRHGFFTSMKEFESDNIGEPEYWMPLPELPRKKRSEAA